LLQNCLFSLEIKKKCFKKLSQEKIRDIEEQRADSDNADCYLAARNLPEPAGSVEGELRGQGGIISPGGRVLFLVTTAESGGLHQK